MKVIIRFWPFKRMQIKKIKSVKTQYSHQAVVWCGIFLSGILFLIP